MVLPGETPLPALSLSLYHPFGDYSDFIFWINHYSGNHVYSPRRHRRVREDDSSETTRGVFPFRHCEKRSNPVLPGTWIATSFFTGTEKLLAMTGI